MLKIRKNINLDELKNFGFKLNDNTGKYELIERDNILGNSSIFINSWNRRILFRQDVDDDTKCLETLYDLILSGFVEKIYIDKEV